MSEGNTPSPPPVVKTTWPECAPGEKEEHFVTVVCGNSHLHWAFHNGVEHDGIPQLFWRTPTLEPGDLEEDEHLAEALSRHLPQHAHDYIFGKDQNNATTETAEAISRTRPGEPRLAVYLVSTNSDQIEYLRRLWGSVPSRMYLMQPDDFFSRDDGRYDGMGVDRLATLRGALQLYGAPALVFDGGSATTYTASDATGRILGGGIGPGLKMKFRSLYTHTDALPQIEPDEVLRRVAVAIERKKPLPTFAADTKEAMMVDVLNEFALKGRNVIQHWLDASTGSRSVGKRWGVTDNDSRYVVVTGGDGEVLAKLFEPDSRGILECASTSGRNQKKKQYHIQLSKHIIHYGMSSALMRQVNLRRGALNPDGDEKYLGQRVAKVFAVEDEEGDNIFRGTIESVSTEINAKEKGPLFFVRYDDGDKEHITQEELPEMLALYNEHGEKSGKSMKNGKKKKKANADAPKKGASPPKKAGKRAAPASNGPTEKKKAKKSDEDRKPRDYIGNRVAKNFSGDIYFGTVTNYFDDTEGEEPYWHIEYDDGDEEDYNIKELKKGIKLHGKKKAGDPKATAEEKAGDSKAPVAKKPAQSDTVDSFADGGGVSTEVKPAVAAMQKKDEDGTAPAPPKSDASPKGDVPSDQPSSKDDEAEKSSAGAVEASSTNAEPMDATPTDAAPMDEQTEEAAPVKSSPTGEEEAPVEPKPDPGASLAENGSSAAAPVAQEQQPVDENVTGAS